MEEGKGKGGKAVKDRRPEEVMEWDGKEMGRGGMKRDREERRRKDKEEREREGG